MPALSLADMDNFILTDFAKNPGQKSGVSFVIPDLKETSLEGAPFSAIYKV